ncbi:thiol:disulfide interchange protein DsbA/DsbL [Shewanella maritima]|uniref:thiol:disulfide interchange protein DsbA/DsbL n=1 Tax=Shewanella maritima TaxID=2520507 RepID=UPI003736977B
MKKVLMLVAAFMFAPMAAQAAQFEEGKHYTVINNGPGSAKPEITEYFSFFCGHCFNFATTVLPKIKQTLPEGVSFNQNHVEFIGRDMGIEMSRAFAVAHQLNVEKKIEDAIFRAIHVNKQRFATRDDIRKVFIANGVAGKDFDAAANSFMVNAQMSKMKRDTENAKISGVPALVVNGKYRVETGAVKSYDELLEIAYYLAQNK